MNLLAHIPIYDGLLRIKKKLLKKKLRSFLDFICNTSLSFLTMIRDRSYITKAEEGGGGVELLLTLVIFLMVKISNIAYGGGGGVLEMSKKMPT